MIDYETFKKEHLTEWVDRSQAARKAAEELANKDATSLRDRYKLPDDVLLLNGKRVEVKRENEKKSDGDIYFTWDEAVERFGEPDSDGWRLPTKEELDSLCNYSYSFDKEAEQGIIDGRIFLPAACCRNLQGIVVNPSSPQGSYWSSTSYDKDPTYAMGFCFALVARTTVGLKKSFGRSVRLVRDAR